MKNGIQLNIPSERKRESILAAAKKTFIAHGYAGASMDSIAEAAPVSKPTLYKHFSSKHDLFVAVIVRQCDGVLATPNDETLAVRDPVNGLKSIAFSFVDLLYTKESLALYRLLIAEQQNFPELGHRVYASTAVPIIDRIASYLRQLHEHGLIHLPDARISSELLMGMLQGVQHFRCLMGLQATLSRLEREQLVESALQLFWKGHQCK